MKTLEDLQKAIADLNQDFGAAAAPEENRTVKIFKHSKFLSKNPKWGKVREGAETIDRAVQFETLECGQMHGAIKADLKDLGYDVVLSNFYYQGSEADIFGLHAGRITEFELKNSPLDFGNDFKKLYNIGKVTVDKHGYLEAGKAMPHYFYFVCPKGMLTKDDVPAHCGLITASKTDLQGPEPTDTIIALTIEKQAPLLHDDYVSVSTVTTIAKRLYSRYQNLVVKTGVIESEIHDQHQRVAASIARKKK